MDADADIAAVAELLGNPARARVMMALADGRALPASVLATEAGVAASTASEHLGRLMSAGLLSVERHGRHRYYRIDSPQVIAALEALAQIAPPAPISSLREHTRAHALREGRLCYDHVAGRLGVALMSALIQRDAITGGDGVHHPQSAHTDHLSAPGHDVDYTLTQRGAELIGALGVDVGALSASRRPLIRYCIDWTEQRHHLAGALGAAIAARLFELDWLRHRRIPRAVELTERGAEGLARELGVALAA
jgi:DNA-binding transcriptional ArsR family regulator